MGLRPETRALAWILAAIRQRYRGSLETSAWLAEVPAGPCPWPLRLPGVSRAFLAVVDARFPGTSRHLLARKLWFHEQCHAAPSQILCLGPGLDPLPGALRRRPGIDRVLEVDLPPVLARRRQLQLCGAADSFAADLHAGLPEACLAALDPSRPTLCLAEGLLMYLDPEAVTRLLHTLHHRLAGLQLCISFVLPGALTRLHRSLERRRTGDGLRWTCHPAELGSLCQRLGLPVPQIHQPAGNYGECFARIQGE